MTVCHVALQVLYKNTLFKIVKIGNTDISVGDERVDDSMPDFFVVWSSKRSRIYWYLIKPVERWKRAVDVYNSTFFVPPFFLPSIFSYHLLYTSLFS